jgi:hypothetical protein
VVFIGAFKNPLPEEATFSNTQGTIAINIHECLKPVLRAFLQVLSVPFKSFLRSHFQVFC